MQSNHLLFLEDAEPAVRPKIHLVLAPPKIQPLHEVFAEAMLEDTSAHQRRSTFDWIASIGVHFAVLATLLILPLYFTNGLDSRKLNLTFLATPAMPPGPPPAPLVSAAARPARIAPVRLLTPGRLTAPSFIPKAIVTTPDAPAAPPDEAMMGVPGGVPGGQIGGVLGGVLGGFSKGAPPVPVAVFGPDPDYPVLARQAHLSGVVIIEAVIDEQGKVTAMRVVSGHPILIPAAMSAVSKRRYEPTVLDGEATPIDLRVEISFRFS
jgi:protein TonB